MCGIIGYVGSRAAKPLLIQGLERLEYRGYDSAGLSLVDQQQDVELIRAVGNLAELRAVSDEKTCPSAISRAFSST